MYLRLQRLGRHFGYQVAFNVDGFDMNVQISETSNLHHKKHVFCWLAEGLPIPTTPKFGVFEKLPKICLPNVTMHDPPSKSDKQGMIHIGQGLYLQGRSPHRKINS